MRSVIECLRQGVPTHHIANAVGMAASTVMKPDGSPIRKKTDAGSRIDVLARLSQESLIPCPAPHCYRERGLDLRDKSDMAFCTFLDLGRRGSEISLLRYEELFSDLA